MIYMIDMIETTAQRDTERMREHAERMLTALQRIQATSYDSAAVDTAAEAIEYASGAHDPDCYPEDGYSVDAAGTFGG